MYGHKDIYIGKMRFDIKFGNKVSENITMAVKGMENMREHISNFFELQGYDFDEQGNLMVDDLDSIEFINLIISLEEQFNIEIPDDLLLIDSIASIDAIESVIQLAKERKLEN